MKYLASFATAFLLSAGAFAQSGGYQLGDKVANFSLKGSNQQTTSLSDFASAKTVVLVFTNNQCPYAKLYENRLVTLASAYASQGVQFVFVNPGVGDGSETLQDMASKKYTFPYLADEGQSLSKQFGATKTPEAFVLHNTGGEFVLKYKGAIDDNAQVESGVQNYYLKNTIDAMLANKTVSAGDKRATGCLIKKY
ncbi:thioredoxin family protein [Pontibacter sp. E15-1]|uniref:thioredoxin family protein n=1 Tax=Pontibacter sp. E15-1 TaxID=2919918 RepID=UPI001F4F8E76|nr:thioredoxin family protein [Pontibacter sp. E15-1]MCJ8165177.1 thioredoxin family protein [Pontibacter sp. E15-1]